MNSGVDSAVTGGVHGCASVDHDDWDHVPYAGRLSDLLAELSLVEDLPEVTGR